MKFEKALLDPRKFFEAPSDIVDTPDLTKSQKKQILLRWEEDARQLQDASNEGMVGGEQPQLRSVREALSLIDRLAD